MSPQLNQPVTITMPLAQWANVVAAVGYSPLSLSEKESINSVIFQAAHDTPIRA